MGVKKEETTENECKRKFRMSENVYLSNREIMLPVRMKTENDYYIRRRITVSIVYREDELFLCGLKTLIEWKAAVFYERSEMMFDETKKRVYMSISGGGHQLVKLETLGEISHEETVLYIEKNGIGANKKEIEKLHRVLNHKGVRIWNSLLGMQEGWTLKPVSYLKKWWKDVMYVRKTPGQDQNHPWRYLGLQILIL